MIRMTTANSRNSASMLGHLFFHSGAFVSLVDEPLRERINDAAAGVCSVPSSSSLPYSLARRGVSSVVLLEGCDRFEREERPDLCEVGRELGVLVAARGPSGVSMAAAMGDRVGRRIRPRCYKSSIRCDGGACLSRGCCSRKAAN